MNDRAERRDPPPTFAPASRKGWSDSTLIACMVGADPIERGKLIRLIAREEAEGDQ